MTEMFKIGILFGDKDDRPPAQIDPGFEFAEVPVSILLAPNRGESWWQQSKAQIKAWNLPPVTVSSHFIGSSDMFVTGPDVDWEMVEFWTKRAFKRLGDLGVKVTGCYGAHFPFLEGYDRTKCTDQAIRFCNLMSEEAAKYGIIVALEPMASLQTLFPLYVDGLAFVKEVNCSNIRLMADMNYFLKIPQSFDVVAKAPELCMHAHIAGQKGQPGIGTMPHREFFRALRNIGYTGGVSCACPWVGEFGSATTVALDYCKKLRDEVYTGK
jgi:sugar phosphate isomerase/epimerase